MILDSNILIYGAKPEYGPVRAYLQTLGDNVQISAITAVEVLGFHRITEEEKQIAEAILQTVTWLPVDMEIVLEAIRLRQQRKRSLGDSIIAATALLHKLPLLTNNTADFTDIPGLTVIPMASVL